MIAQSADKSNGLNWRYKNPIADKNNSSISHAILNWRTLGFACSTLKHTLRDQHHLVGWCLLLLLFFKRLQTFYELDGDESRLFFEVVVIFPAHLFQDHILLDLVIDCRSIGLHAQLRRSLSPIQGAGCLRKITSLFTDRHCLGSHTPVDRLIQTLLLALQSS